MTYEQTVKLIRIVSELHRSALHLAKVLQVQAGAGIRSQAHSDVQDKWDTLQAFFEARGNVLKNEVICPACLEGDHEFGALLCHRIFKCDCTCNEEKERTVEGLAQRIIGRLLGIDEEDLTKAEQQIKDICIEILEGPQ